MIPLRLTLENFMPYRGRHQPLVLEGLGIACLAGENGAGKSSLLDALTWALWGQCRSRHPDDLVSAGESEMAVEVEFRVGEGRYRVLRRHRKSRGGSRPGQTAVDLQTWDGSAFRPWSGTNARETQERLTDLLRLDYDTFTNTAFLLQGRADLFTLKTPAERKRLLGEILGLAFYDTLADKAREEAREREKVHFSATQRLADLDRELAGEEALRAERAVHEEALEGLRPQLATAESEVREAEEKLARLTQLEAERERLRIETATLAADLARLKERGAAIAARIAEAETVIAREAEIEAGYAALVAARAERDGYGERARRFALLTSQRAPLDQAVAAGRARLERETAALDAKAQPLRDLGMRATAIAAERAIVESSRAEMDVAWETHAARTARLQSLAGEIQARQARMGDLSREREDLTKRLALLTADADKAELCPLCGTELGAHGLVQVRDHYRRRGQEIATEMNALQKDVNAFQEERRRLDAEVQREERRLRQAMAQADVDLGRLRGDEDRATKAVQELGEIELQLRDARLRLEGEDYALAERAALAGLDQETARLAYDPEGHRKVAARVTALERWDGEHRRLDTARVTLEQDLAARADLSERIAQAEAQMAEKSARLAVLTDATRELAPTQGRLAVARAAEKGLREQVEREAQEVARLGLQLEEMARRRAERRLRAGEARRAAEEKAVYDELAGAFSVRGVQALLIETALPELEEEANAILARMTDNRMHVSLRTQRETRTGNQQETLEVLIADEWGTRPYELYSGGESFRINFALRIGLSKLLARRAGAQVPLLFIDEGFGTQDQLGRERLVEAISTLQQDPAFRDGLVLVITHMEDIKEQFDTRIQVTKTEGGSRFTVVGA